MAGWLGQVLTYLIARVTCTGQTITFKSFVFVRYAGTLPVPEVSSNIEPDIMSECIGKLGIYIYIPIVCRYIA